MRPPFPFSAIVLAAGRSRRMGEPKAFLRLAGQSLVVRVCAAALQGGAERVVVIAGSTEEIPGLASAPRISALLHAQLASDAARVEVVAGCPDGTPLDSLRCGLARLPAGHSLLLWPVDYPFGDAMLVRGLALALARCEQIAVPEAQGERGHPILLGNGVVRELSQGELPCGVRTVVNRDPSRIITVAASDARVCEDLDTPLDAARHGVELTGAAGPAQRSGQRPPRA